MKVKNLKLTDFKNLKPANINRLLESNLFFLWATVLAVAVAYNQVLLMPQLRQISARRPEVRKLSDDISRIKNIMANKERLEKRRATLVEKINFYEQSLPSEKEIPALLESLSKLAAETGIKIDSIQPLQIKKKAKSRGSALYQELPILIRGKCGYHALGYFINKLENAARFMKITDISISGGAGSYKTQNFTLEVTTYVSAPLGEK
jgi:Tfp pilus assembly protein PilO